MTQKVSFYNGFRNASKAWILSIFGLKIQMWLFCWFLNSMTLKNTMKIMLNDVQKSYKMTVICTSKEARALKKKVKLKRDFFLLSLRHCCWFPFCCRCNISRWFSALDFFGHLLAVNANPPNSLVLLLTTKENSWEMIESSIKGRWFIGFSFLCVP